MHITGASTCSGSLCLAGKYGRIGATSSEAATFSGSVCAAGKYGQPGSTSSAAATCMPCATGTYINVTGASTCLECRQDSCPFPGTFELSSCTPETNKVCEVYVHDVPTNGKIAIACGQTPFVFLICCIVLKFTKLGSMMGDGKNWKWTFFKFHDWRHRFHHSLPNPHQEPLLFILGVPGQPPSLASLLCSVAASLVLSFNSRIKQTWPTRAFIFLSGTAEGYEQDWPEKWNSRVLLGFEKSPATCSPGNIFVSTGASGVHGVGLGDLGSDLGLLLSEYRHQASKTRQGPSGTMRDGGARSECFRGSWTCFGCCMMTSGKKTVEIFQDPTQCCYCTLSASQVLVIVL